jgi:hypothetical protein
MNCLIAFLATCVFDPSQVYVTTSIQADVRRARYAFVSWCGDKWCSGPVGEIRLGVMTPVTETVTLDYGVGHKSFIATESDQGLEFAFVNLTWRPFK